MSYVEEFERKKRKKKIMGSKNQHTSVLYLHRSKLINGEGFQITSVPDTLNTAASTSCTGMWNQEYTAEKARFHIRYF